MSKETTNWRDAEWEEVCVQEPQYEYKFEAEGFKATICPTDHEFTSVDVRKKYPFVWDVKGDGITQCSGFAKSVDQAKVLVRSFFTAREQMKEDK